MPTTLAISTLHFKSYASLSQSIGQNSQRGRIIIITGGARGIGLSIASAFVSAGALSVHILGRTASTLSAVKSDLEARNTGCAVHTHATDISNEPAVNEAFESIKRSSFVANGLVGFVLIHAAAYLPQPEDLVQTPPRGGGGGGGGGEGEWWRTFEVNVKGTFLIFHAFSNLLRAIPPDLLQSQGDGNSTPSQTTTRDDEAVIINLMSASAYAFTAPGVSAYASSKLAAMRVAECVAYEGIARSYRARIVNLHPGAVKTEMWEKSGGESVGIPCNDDNLVPRFALWLTLPAAQFLHGRTVEANWDIDELLSQKDVILAENLLTATLRGYPFNSAESWVKVVQKSLPKEGATDVEK